MSRRCKDGGLAAGTTTFVLTRSLVADRVFKWQAVTRCIQCGGRFTLQRGKPAPVFRVGNEIVGACCPQCLTPESRQLLESMRAAVAR